MTMICLNVRTEFLFVNLVELALAITPFGMEGFCCYHFICVNMLLYDECWQSVLDAQYPLLSTISNYHAKSWCWITRRQFGRAGASHNPFGTGEFCLLILLSVLATDIFVCINILFRATCKPAVHITPTALNQLASGQRHWGATCCTQ